jgi:hypothetical protein
MVIKKNLNAEIWRKYFQNEIVSEKNYKQFRLDKGIQMVCAELRI